MSLTQEQAHAMTLPERGLWLQCEVMKLEIAQLKVEREQLVALAKFGRDVLDLHEADMLSVTLEEFAYKRGLLTVSATKEQKMEETPLAQMPEGIE